MKKFWESDRDLFRIARRELFPAFVGDILDKMGLFHQFPPARIKPISAHMVIIGRAMPVLEADVFAELQHETHNPLMKKTVRNDVRGARLAPAGRSLYLYRFVSRICALGWIDGQQGTISRCR